jgi:hypothetical protein
MFKQYFLFSPSHSSQEELPTWQQFSQQFVLSIGIGLIIVGALYPGFLLFTKYPMQGFGQELQDPVAGYLNFIPGLRVFVYEVLHNHNFLWSNLRGFGLSLLGHDIQVAPLFPLTWLALFVPEPYFWNIMVASRLVLLFSGSYLIALYLFSFTRTGALLFAATFIFNMFVLRWLNHPWQNGLLAGIWYFLFLGLSVRFCGVQEKKTIPYWLQLSLVISVYCMVTNGFPEEAMLFAILIVFLFPFLVLEQRKNGGVNWGKLGRIIVIGHVLGFALSSFQLFAFLEFLHSRDDLGCRKALSVMQMGLDEIGPFLWSNAVNWGQRYGGLHKSVIGLTILLLSGIGIFSRLLPPYRLRWLEVGIVVPSLFYMVKNFPVIPSLNTFIGQLPLINELRFNVYCFPYIQLFFSYFSVIGFHFVALEKNHLRQKVLIFLASFLGTTFVVFRSLKYSGLLIGKNFSIGTFSNHLQVISLFLLFSLLLIVSLLLDDKKKWKSFLLFSCLCLVLIEIGTTRLNDFIPLNTFSQHYLHHATWATSLEKALAKKHIDMVEVRSNDKYGRYLSAGIATVDHGAPAVISKRNLMLRRAIYNGPWRGFLELKTRRISLADDIIARNIVSDNVYRGGSYGLQWSQLQLDKEVPLGGIDNAKGVRVISSSLYDAAGKGIIEFSGWAVAQNFSPDESEYYFLLKGKKENFTTPVWRIKRYDVARRLGETGYADSGWKVRIDPLIFNDQEYTLELRLYEKDKSSYTKLPLGTLNVNKQLKRTVDYPLKEIDSIFGTHCHFRKNSLTRAYMAGKCVPTENPESAAKKISVTGQYKQGMVYLEDLQQTDKELCNSLDTPWQQVKIKDDTGSLVKLATVQGPGVMVLSDTYYPGWYAYDAVSGNPIPVKPANIAMRGVVLPESRKYQIVFFYRPPWVLWSSLLAAGASLFLVFSGLVSFRKNLGE